MERPSTTSSTGKIGQKDADGEDATTLGAGLDESDPFWLAYVKESGEFDSVMVERWNKEMDAMLVFAGLFAAILTALMIESRKDLQADQQAQTNIILIQILNKLNTPELKFDHIQIDEDPDSKLIKVLVYIMWFLGLMFSLASAMGSLLLREWVREYSKPFSNTGTPRIDARRRHQRYEAFIKWDVPMALNVISILLHFTFLFFFAGLIHWLLERNSIIGTSMIAIHALLFPLMMISIIITVLPLIYDDCPYRTPVTTLLSNIGQKCSKLARRSPKITHTPDQHGHLDVPAVGWLLTAAKDPTTVATAAKSILTFKGTTAGQHYQILERGGGHVIAGLVRSNLILEPSRTIISPSAQINDLDSFIQSIDHLSSAFTQDSILTNWPFEEFTHTLGLLLDDETTSSVNGVSGQSEASNLKVNIIITYSRLSLQRYFRRPIPRDPWVNSPDLTKSISNLLGACKPNTTHNDSTRLKLIRTLVNIGSTIGPLRSGEFGLAIKRQMFGAYVDVLESSPFPSLSLLQAALLGIESLLQQTSNTTRFLDNNATADSIIDVISRVLSQSPLSSWKIMGYENPAPLFHLVGRFGRMSILSNCSSLHRNRLVNNIWPVSESSVGDIDYCYSLSELYDFGHYPHIPPERSSALVTRLTRSPDDFDADSFARFYRVTSTGATLPDTYEMQFLESYSRILFNEASHPYTSQKCFIRGLLRLQYPYSEWGIMGAVVKFLKSVTQDVNDIQAYLLAFKLIRRIVTSLPRISIPIFIQSQGFEMLQSIIQLPLPNADAVLCSALMALTKAIIYQATLIVEQHQPLEDELNSTQILFEIHSRPALSAHLTDDEKQLGLQEDRVPGKTSGHVEIQWAALVSTLTGLMPNVRGREELAERLRASSSMTNY